mgnify:CR=1 FL=1|tara:strand:- start:62 stop:505 length:444 start_codon:yes stop_codon:yes gene_type:complete
MKKSLLTERFQQLAGIKPLYENEASQVLKVTSEGGTLVLIIDPIDIKAFLAGEEVYGEDQDGGSVEVSLDNAQDHQITEEAFGAAGSDKRTGQVIGDILQLIKSTGIDPEEVIEAIKMSDNSKNYGLPKMDPDTWGFRNPKTGEYNK